MKIRLKCFYASKTVGSLCVAAALLAPVIASSQQRALRVSYSAPATVYLPVWAAKEAGFFAKNNLAVELLYVGSSPIALAALLSDDLDVIAGGGTAVPNAYVRGLRDLCLFATLDHRFPFKVYAVPQIADVAGLRGKRYGVTRFGGTLDFASRYFLKSVGLDPVRDVQLVQVGNTADILVALANGSVDAGTLTFPYNISAKKSGFRELADMSQSGARNSTAAFAAKRKLLVDQRPRMQAFVKALIEGLHFVKTQPGPSLNILQRYTRTADREILKISYDEYAEKVWPRVPTIEPEDLKLTMEHIGQTNAKAREIDPASLIYSSLVDEIGRSGFVEQLYK